MSEEKMFCRKQLQALGVKCEPLGLAITRHIVDGKTEINGDIFSISLREVIGAGVEIKTEGKEDSCLITYESMVKMANAMGLFDNIIEE
jgi:hypothetical protein|nr:MAG TPA: hypothetical protein [Caudoviricetes sp.]